MGSDSGVPSSFKNDFKMPVFLSVHSAFAFFSHSLIVLW